MVVQYFFSTFNVTVYRCYVVLSQYMCLPSRTFPRSYVTLLCRAQIYSLSQYFPYHNILN